MSPLWRDQLRIVLCPHQVILARFGRGWRPRLLTKKILTCASASTGPAWQVGLDALIAETQKPEWQKADAVVILSNHFMRYVLIPWVDALSDETEQTEYARDRFASVYGEASKQWDVRVSLVQAGTAHVASAVDRALIEALEAACKKNHLRLTSIQPYLMAAFNQWRKQFQEGVQWLVLAESGRLCIALLQNGVWRWLRCQRADAAALDDLPLLLTREKYLANVHDNGKNVWLYAPEQKDPPPADTDWSFQRLSLPAYPGFSPATDAPFSMALNGVG